MVHEIERFGSELQIHAFCDSRVFDQRKIEVDSSGVRTSGSVRPTLPIRKVRRIDERIRVEPALARRIVELRALARRVRPVGGIVARAANNQRNACLHHADRIQLPAANQTLQEAIARVPLLAGSERQLIQRRDHRALGDVAGIDRLVQLAVIERVLKAVFQ